MKKRLFILSAALLVTSALQANEAEKLYDAKCAMCHTKTKPIDKSKVIAPALMGVMKHVKMSYPKKEDAMKFMADYIYAPSKDKAICMPKKIKRFGLMPSQKENVTKEELEKITSWMFDNFPPAGFKGMGHKGMGKKAKKANKNSPFLINSSNLPHMTKTIKQNWDNSELALTDEQKEKLLVIRKETIGTIKKIKQQLMPLKEEVIDEIKDAEDPKTLQKQLEEISKLKLEATKAHLKCIYDTSNLLSKKQLEYLFPNF